MNHADELALGRFAGNDGWFARFAALLRGFERVQTQTALRLLFMTTEAILREDRFDLLREINATSGLLSCRVGLGP
jgi:hypothetical protein